MKKIEHLYKLTETIGFTTSIKGKAYVSDYLMISNDGFMQIRASHTNPFFFDGCSPKFLIFGKLIGTPDGPIDPITNQPMRFRPSALHDLLYQHIGQPKFKLTRKECDQAFREALKFHGDSKADLFYYGLRMNGGMYYNAFVKDGLKWINYGDHVKNLGDMREDEFYV